MATYKITINERTKEGRELIAAIRKSKVTEFNRDDLEISDPTEMTKAQFYAKIDKSAEQVYRDQKAGRLITLKTNKDIHDFMRNL